MTRRSPDIQSTLRRATVIASLFACLPSTVQADEPEFRSGREVGLVAGPTLSTIHYQGPGTYDLRGRSGITAGFRTRGPVHPYIDLRLDIRYLPRGFSEVLLDPLTGEPTGATVRSGFHYLHAPLVASTELGLGEDGELGNVFVQAGLSASVLLARTTSDPDQPGAFQDLFAFDHFDLGATVGAGATLTLGHSYAATLELRYNRTLLNHITSSDEDFAVFSDFTVLFGIHYDLPF